MKFATVCHSVSHGSEEFFAEGGVVEIPEDKVYLFQALIDSGELVKVEDVPAEKSLDEGDEPKKKGKRG
jgi:hypothetical protein